MARHQLLESGYDNFVINQIAEDVGISPGNLQYYFPTRDDLLVAVCLDVFNESRYILLNVNNEAASPRDQLLGVVNNLLNNWASAGGYAYMVLALLAVHNPKVRALRRSIYLSFYSELEQLLQNIAPELSPAKRKNMVRVITSVLDGVVLQSGMGPGDMREAEGVELEADVRELVLSLVGL